MLLVNLLLVIPLLWLAAHWSLRPIGTLAGQIRELESSQREALDPNPPQELRSLVRNLNLLLKTSVSAIRATAPPSPILPTA